MEKVSGHEELTPISCLAPPAAERRKADVQAIGGESLRQRLDKGTLMIFHPSRRFLFANLLSVGLTGAVVVMAPCVFLFVTKLYRQIHFFPVILLALCVVGVMFVAYACFHFFTIEYEINDAYVIVSEGFFWKSRRSTPVDKITNVDIRQGPLERLLGVSRIWIFTPSTGALTPEALLEGLEDAWALKSLILSKSENQKRLLSASVAESHLFAKPALDEIIQTLKSIESLLKGK